MIGCARPSSVSVTTSRSRLGRRRRSSGASARRLARPVDHRRGRRGSDRATAATADGAIGAGAAGAAGIETLARRRRAPRRRGERRQSVLGLGDAGRDPELADGEVVVGREPHARRGQERVGLAAGVLGEVLLQLADERALVGDELLPVGAREVDRVLVRDVDARDRDGAVLVHLLRELAGELDGLHVRSEGAAEDALEEALDLALDGAQDAHCGSGRLPAKGSGRSGARARRGRRRAAQRAEHDRERRQRGRERRGSSADLADAEHGDPPQPAPAGVREQRGASAEHERRRRGGRRCACRTRDERLHDVGDARRAVDAEVGHDDARERQRARRAGRRRRRRRARRRTPAARARARPRAGWTASGSSASAPTRRAAGRRRRGARRARRASRARASRRRATPYATAAAWATFPSGKTGTNSAIASPRRGERSVASAGGEREEERRDRAARTAAAWPRARRSTAASAGGGEPLLERERGGGGLARGVALPRRAAARPVAARRGERPPGARRRAARRTAAATGRSRAPTRPRRRAAGGRSGRVVADRRRAGLDRGGDLGQRDAPERVLARRAHSQSSTPTAQTSLAAVASPPREPLRRDVGERAGHVADRGQRVGLVELGEAEVEQPDRDARPFLDEHVRRLHVPVDDPEPVRVREGVEDLRGGLDGVAVAELARSAAPRASCWPWTYS